MTTTELPNNHSGLCRAAASSPQLRYLQSSVTLVHIPPCVLRFGCRTNLRTFWYWPWGSNAISLCNGFKFNKYLRPRSQDQRIDWKSSNRSDGLTTAGNVSRNQFVLFCSGWRGFDDGLGDKRVPNHWIPSSGADLAHWESLYSGSIVFSFKPITACWDTSLSVSVHRSLPARYLLFGLHMGNY